MKSNSFLFSAFLFLFLFFLFRFRCFLFSFSLLYSRFFNFFSSLYPRHSFLCSLPSLLFLLKLLLLTIPGWEGRAGISHLDDKSHFITIPRSSRPRISEPVIILFSLPQ